MLAQIGLPARRSRSIAAVKSLAVMFKILHISLPGRALALPLDNKSVITLRPPVVSLLRAAVLVRPFLPLLPLLLF